MAAIILAGVSTIAVVFHDPPDTATHVARECRFIAALERRRMVRAEAHGPAPSTFWRAEDRTGGAPRPDLSRLPGAGLPNTPRSWLIQRLTPKRDLPSIDCGAVFDAMGIPKVITYNEGPPTQELRLQYSRVSFLPGDRYALVGRTQCSRYNDRWDQAVWFDLWRRRDADWELTNVASIAADFRRPRLAAPMRCFDPAYDPMLRPQG
ncbi:hypothetical protein CSW64_14650 [Caulobacter mirabilis]|uniref:Uncharacterized protein n=1 Tax=Caulobacter mirabilis TaxID=69666 RepID=A0A2D2AZW8_9CAUL|nr:hypothetical protein CSW64_14650 [Caulobacter mirabilis]